MSRLTAAQKDVVDGLRRGLTLVAWWKRGKKGANPVGVYEWVLYDQEFTVIEKVQAITATRLLERGVIQCLTPNKYSRRTYGLAPIP